MGGLGLIATGGQGDEIGGPGVLAQSGIGDGSQGGDGIDAMAVTTSGIPAGPAGSFTGDVTISGNLSVSGTKSFRIDHPLNPANKYL